MACFLDLINVLKRLIYVYLTWISREVLPAISAQKRAIW
jgi:hypothetical protein